MGLVIFARNHWQVEHPYSLEEITSNNRMRHRKNGTSPWHNARVTRPRALPSVAHAHVYRYNHTQGPTRLVPTRMLLATVGPVRGVWFDEKGWWKWMVPLCFIGLEERPNYVIFCHVFATQIYTMRHDITSISVSSTFSKYRAVTVLLSSVTLAHV